MNQDRLYPQEAFHVKLATWVPCFGKDLGQGKALAAGGGGGPNRKDSSAEECGKRKTAVGAIGK
jgi:hypothetical protein